MAPPSKKSPLTAKKTPVKGAKAPAGGATSVKIIAGEWRGRVLRFPEADGLRPTGSRIRETLFNWLAPIIANSRCLDAFSGSGALGFEALSRGASQVTMLEPNAIANKLLHANSALLGAEACSIFGGRAEQWLAAAANQTFDIVFIDPPFALELWSDILPKLEDNQWLAADAYIYIETPKGYPLVVPANWQMHRAKDAGNVTFALFRRTSAVT